MPSPQARYWICTIAESDWQPCLPTGALWCLGQLERGETTGYLHWQFVVSFAQKKTLSGIRAVLPSTGHYERTRSVAAERYVTKLETRVGDPFEFGERALNRNSATDWDRVKQKAKSNDLESIPSDIYIRYYRTLRAIASDHARPLPLERTTVVYWGPTGTGKSRRAWAESGDNVYPKDPRSKFWCGYQGQANVILDEFRGAIDISHLLRWLDRYPVHVEIKGSSVPLAATKIWITSNLHPSDWYPELDRDTTNALMRRLTIEKME